MQDLNDKITGNFVGADEWNQIPSEIQNIIEATGQTLSGGNLNQLGIGVAEYAANGTFYIDSGAADAYVATKIGSKQAVLAYIDGMGVSFNVDVTNTGASTINVDSLGVKNIVYQGVALNGGELTAGLIVNLIFDNANDRFELIPNLSNFIATDGGWTIGSPTAGSLGAGTLNIENQLAVGPGLSDPNGLAHFHSASAGAISADGNADEGVFENDTHVGLSLIGGTTSTGNIYFADSSSATKGRITYSFSSNFLEFVTNDTSRMILTLGMEVGSPTGGDKGTGSINAQAVYDDNVLLTCYVFDQQLDNSIDLNKWDEKVPDRIIKDRHTLSSTTIKRVHGPLRKFQEKTLSIYNPLDIDMYSRHWKEKRHLTSMPNEINYDPLNGAMASGEWIQRLIETAEIQAVHISILNDRLKLLEA